MNFERDEWVGLLLLCSALVAGLIGWVLNLVMIVHWSEATGMLVLRCIGAFIPIVGAVLGWIR